MRVPVSPLSPPQAPTLEPSELPDIHGWIPRVASALVVVALLVVLVFAIVPALWPRWIETALGLEEPAPAARPPTTLQDWGRSSTTHARERK